MLVNSALKMFFRAAPKLRFKPQYSEYYSTALSRCFCTSKPPATTTTATTTSNLEDVKTHQIKVEGTKIKVELNGNTFSYEVDKEVQGGQHGTGGSYMILFTCNNCETKNTKKFNKNAYHHGVVLIRCEGCDKLHLIADNLGWFRDQKVNIEDIAKETGRLFLKVDDNPEVLAALGQKLKFVVDEKQNKTDPLTLEEKK